MNSFTRNSFHRRRHRREMEVSRPNPNEKAKLTEQGSFRTERTSGRGQMIREEGPRGTTAKVSSGGDGTPKRVCTQGPKRTDLPRKTDGPGRGPEHAAHLPRSGAPSRRRAGQVRRVSAAPGATWGSGTNPALPTLTGTGSQTDPAPGQQPRPPTPEGRSQQRPLPESWNGASNRYQKRSPKIPNIRMLDSTVLNNTWVKKKKSLTGILKSFK